jgi:archaetidylinositol phosphate synthase
MPPATDQFRDAGRAQESLFAPLEKRMLVRMAQAAPRWINSDHLTLLGFVAMFCAGVCYWLARYDRRMLLLVILWLAVNWLGDSLDGTLARVRNRQRPRYGFYVDHITDAFGTLFLIAGMGLSGYMSPLVAAGLLVVYFLLSIQAYLATYARGTFQLSYWKFSPTELRLLLVAGNIALFWRPVVSLFGRHFLLFDVGGVAGIIGMSLMAIASSIRNTVALYRSERLPPL